MSAAQVRKHCDVSSSHSSGSSCRNSTPPCIESSDVSQDHQSMSSKLNVNVSKHL